MAQQRAIPGELVTAELRAGGKSPPPLQEPEAPRGSDQPTDYEGRILGIERSRIVGWAWDRSNPISSLDVELYIDSECVGRGRADAFDEVLAGRNGGDGAHRFEIGLERIPDKAPPFILRAVIAGSEKELEPRLTLASQAEIESLLMAQEYIGRVTGIVDGALCGWVLNTKNASEQPLLTLWDGDVRVLSGSVVGRMRVVTDSGVTKRVHRFELPLPPNAVDGNPHSYSVRVGDSGPQLAGCPLSFGPTDMASIGRVLASLAERTRQLDRRLDGFRPELDHAAIERRITIQILERVDMMLNIHRDAVERELAVVRRQLAPDQRLAIQEQTDVILPAATVSGDFFPAPTSNDFSVITRAQPSFDMDLGRPAEDRELSGGFEPKEGKGLLLKGDGFLTVPALPRGPAAVVIAGSGASRPSEFAAIVPSVYRRILTGRVEIQHSGQWELIGTTTEPDIGDGVSESFAIKYLTDIAPPSGAICVERVALFDPGRGPERVSAGAPRATVVYLGPENVRGGWYAVDPGPRGGYCWMAAYGELVFRVHQTGTYLLEIPEIRPLVPGIMSKLQVVVGGMPVETEIRAKENNRNVFQVKSRFRAPFDDEEIVRVRLSFPKECVKSPMELGLNKDMRALTVSMRSLLLSAIED